MTAGSAPTDLEGLTVADAMISSPALHGPGVTLDEARSALADLHRHLVLIVDAGRLLGTLDRDDLARASGRGDATALPASRLAGRTVEPDAPLAAVRERMLAS